MGIFANEALLAAAAAIVAFWKGIRAWLDLMVSVVWVRSELGWPCSQIVLRHLHEHYTVGRMGSAMYNSEREFVRPRGRFEAVAIEEAPARRLYWNGLAFLLVTGQRNLSDGAPLARITVSHIRGFLDVATIIVKAHAEYNDAHSGMAKQGTRYRVARHYGLGRGRRHYGSGNAEVAPPSPERAWNDNKDMWRPLGWTRDDLGAVRADEPFRGLVFPPSIERAADTIRRWRESEAFCKERRIPWRLGLLAYGAPGTGKTSFARAIAQEMDLPVHQFHLASMDNEDLYRAWMETTSDSPCMALFEDLDRVFVGQDNRIEGSDLTLDALLNCISGVEQAEGVLSVVTANDPSRLDRALGVPDSNGVSSRPGRLDMAVEFGPMADEQKAALVEMILQPSQDDGTAWFRVAFAEIMGNESLRTPAQVQGAAAEIALQRLYIQDNL